MTTPCGRGLCGPVRSGFEAGRVKNPILCHCEICRRARSSPVTGFSTLRDSAWRWTGEMPAIWHSGPSVTCGFCATCGVPMFHRSEPCPGETDLLAANLEDTGRFTPGRNVFFGERFA